MAEKELPLEQLRARLKQEPCSGAMLLLAETLYRHGQYLQAVETCRQGVARYPENLPLTLILGQALLASEQTLEAQQVLQALVISITRLKEAFAILAGSYQQQGHQESAHRLQLLYDLLAQEESAAQSDTGKTSVTPADIEIKAINKLEKWQKVLAAKLPAGKV
jgi:predicted Zn-dependent protease